MPEASHGGAEGMAGNVRELCTNALFGYQRLLSGAEGASPCLVASDSAKKVARGGTYNTPLWECRTTTRFEVSPDVSPRNMGAGLVFAGGSP